MVPVALWHVCAHAHWTRTQSSQAISYAHLSAVSRVSLKATLAAAGSRAGTRRHGRRTGFVTFFGCQAREYIRLRASSANLPRLQCLPVLRLRSLLLPLADLFNARLPRYLGEQQPSCVKSLCFNSRWGLRVACGTGSIPGSQVRCVRKKRSSAALSSSTRPRTPKDQC